MKVIKLILIAVSALAVHAVFAAAPAYTHYNWQAVDESKSGAFTDAAHWKNGSTGEIGVNIPGPLCRANFGADNGNLSNQFTSDATITLPGGDYTTYSVFYICGATAGHTLTIDGTDGTSFVQGSSDSPIFGTGVPFYLGSCMRTLLMQTYSYNLGDPLAYKTGTFRLTKPKIRIVGGEDNAKAMLHFDSGVFNFYDPNGIPLEKLGGANNADVRVVFFDGMPATDEHEVAFHKDTKFQSVYTLMHPSGAGRLVFDGGEHFASKQFEVQAKTNPGASAELELKNAAHLTVGNFHVGSSAALPEGGRIHVLVDGGSTLTVTNNFQHASYAGKVLVEIKNGSTLEQAGNYTYLGYAANGVTTTVSVVDSTFDASKAKNTFYFGHHNAASAQGFGYLYLTNSTLTTAKSVAIRSGYVEVAEGGFWNHSGSSPDVGGFEGHEGSLVVLPGGRVTAVNPPCAGVNGLIAYRGGEGDHTGNFEVNGGELEVSDGGTVTASRINGKSSTDRFAANGGTVHPTKEIADYLYGFETAVLGANGLTVDADFDIGMSQDFTSAAETVGKLVKSGAATLTFAAGHAPSAVALEVKEGRTVFADSPVTLGGLILNGGTIVFAAGQSLEIDGDVDVVSSKLELPMLAEGTTLTLMTASGTVTGAAAWSGTEIVDGRVAGLSYKFFTEPEDGKTAFKVSVTLARNATISVGDGQSETISTPKDYDDEGVLTVTVGAEGTADVIGSVGTGGIIKDGAGRSVFSGADNIIRGAIEVDAGLLFFANFAAYGLSERMVDDALVLKGGTFEFSGDPNAVTDMRRALCVNAPVNTSAVVLRADTDVKFTDPEVQSGALVKTGAGTLIFETAGKRQLAAGVGTGAPADNNGYVVSSVYQSADFDDYGTPPTREYVGLTVFDGELVLRGTSDIAEFTLLGGFGVGFPTLDVSVQPKVTIDHAKVTMNNNAFYMAQYKQDYASAVTDTYLNVTNGATLDLGWSSITAGYRIYGSGIVSHILIDDSVVKNTTGWQNLLQSSGGGMYLNVRNSGKFLSQNRFVWDGFIHVEIADGGFLGGTEAGDPSTLVPMGARASGVIDVKDDGVLCCKRLFFYNSNYARFENLTLNFDGGVWDTKAAGVDLIFECADRLAINTTGKGMTMNVDAGGVIQVQKEITGDGDLIKTGAGTLVFKTQKIVAGATGVTSLQTGTKEPVDYAQPTTTNEMANVQTLGYTGTTVIREGTVVIADAKSVPRKAKFQVEEGATLDLGGNTLRIDVTGKGQVVNGTAIGAQGFMLILR